MLEPINPIQQAIDVLINLLFEALLWLGGGAACVGTIYIFVIAWLFLRHLPHIDRGE